MKTRDYTRDYTTVTEAAGKLGLSRAWVKRLARDGRIRGAVMVGRQWIIPAGWTYTRTRRPATTDQPR